jgi:hypothetical protein
MRRQVVNGVAVDTDAMEKKLEKIVERIKYKPNTSIHVYRLQNIPANIDKISAQIMMNVPDANNGTPTSIMWNVPL